MNNLKEIQPYRWIVENESEEKDITGRRLILWGGGCFVRNYATKMQLTDLILLDADESKHGQSVLLNNHFYKIDSPEILNDLNSEEYFIIITVEKEDVIHEIKRTIKEIYPAWKNNFCIHAQLIRVYLNITSALMCDPFVHRKIDNANISTELQSYIKKAEEIVEKCISKEEIRGFSVMKQCSRVILSVKGDTKYMLFMPYNRNGQYYTSQNKKKNLEIRKKLQLNKGIIVYEDSQGFMLCRFIESDNDFSNIDKVNDILRNIRYVHESGETIDIELNLWEGIFLLEKKIGLDKNDKLIRKIHDNIIPETKKFEKKLIHGDFSYGNILHSGNKIEIIDWQYMQMGDPMFDICLFYYFVSKHWRHDFCDILNRYYGRTTSITEYRHALAWLILVSYWKYLEATEIFMPQRNELRKELLQMIDEYIL